MTDAGVASEGVRRVHAPRWGRRMALLVAVLVVGVGLTTPWWGRHLAFFNIQSVEVRGTRFAKPSEIANRLRVDSTVSIWISLDTLTARVERHPQVAKATVRRLLPSALVVEIQENEPIALVSTAKGMRAYEEGGRVLPFSPARVPTDLPVVERPDTAVLRLLADLKVESPETFARVSEVRLQGKNDLRIAMFNVRVLAQRGVGAERFRELSSVQQDLERRGIVPLELDLRYKDQIIVRLP